jgi:hypothetical protein
LGEGISYAASRTAEVAVALQLSARAFQNSSLGGRISLPGGEWLGLTMAFDGLLIDHMAGLTVESKSLAMHLFAGCAESDGFTA